MKIPHRLHTLVLITFMLLNAYVHVTVQAYEIFHPNPRPPENLCTQIPVLEKYEGWRMFSWRALNCQGDFTESTDKKYDFYLLWDAVRRKPYVHCENLENPQLSFTLTAKTPQPGWGGKYYHWTVVLYDVVDCRDVICQLGVLHFPLPEL